MGTLDHLRTTSLDFCYRSRFLVLLLFRGLNDKILIGSILLVPFVLQYYWQVLWINPQDSMPHRRAKKFP